MSKDGLRSVACLVLGCLLLLGGAAVPAHLRAVNERVLEVVAEGTATSLQAAERALRQHRDGPARFLAEEAAAGDPPGAAALLEKIEEDAASSPSTARFGGPAEWLEKHVGGIIPIPANRSQPVLGWMLRIEVREALRRALADSNDPAVTTLIACRELEQTAILPAPGSAAGQPMEAALITVSALVTTARMHPGLALEFERAAFAARKGKGTERLENGLLDILGASRHLDWEQLATVAAICPSPASFHGLVAAGGANGENWPLLFAAATLDGGAARLSGFLAQHGTAGLADVRRALRLGEGAVRELLRRGHRIQPAGWVRIWEPKLAGFSARAPQLSLAARYLLWLDGLFLVFLGLRYAWQTSLSPSVRAFQPRPDYSVLLVLTVTAGILMFLISERFLFATHGLALNANPVQLPTLRVRLRTEIPRVTNLAMNGTILGMLVAFFVIQFSIYLVGLSRLRHIRNQIVDDSIKLRLLDNEESMFDAPLYIGIGGSVLALVLKLSGFGDVSLMASYSSTLFGILFCFILKVVHVRPYRQQLILESSDSSQS